MTLLSNRLALTALALLLTLPFLGAQHHLPIATFRQEWLAAILGLCALLPLLPLLPGDDGDAWEIPRTVLLPAAFIVLVWLQFAVAGSVLYENAVLFSLYLAWAMLLMLLACRLEQRLGRTAIADGIAWSLLAGSLLAAGTGAMQLWAPQLGLPYVFPSGGRVVGNLAQPNNFADYLWLGIAAASYLQVRGRLPWPALAAALLPLLAFSLLSGSRSVYLYALALTVWLLLRARRTEGETRRRLLRGALLLLPGLLCLQWLIGVANLGGTSVSSAQRIVASGSYDAVRLTLWRAAADIFSDHPLLGAGFDSYSREFFQRIERFPLDGRGIPEHSHNILFEIAAEFGSAGLGGLLLAAGAWLAGLRRRYDEAGFLALGVLLVLGIHSGLEYPLWYAHFLAIACLMLAIGERERWRLVAARRHRWLLLAGIALGLVTLIGLRGDYLRLEEAARGRQADGTPLPIATRQAWLLESYSRSLWRHYAALQFSVLMPIEADDVDGRLALMREAVHFSPIRDAVFRYAALLQLAGEESEARVQLRRAMLSYPDRIPQARAEIEAAMAEAPTLAPLVELLRQRSF
ncbi:MAG: O-antigen ligase C-terminal domain-containing protein [Rhodocyclales bacterium]|nr:O-antigen ligase C-terminal domain-containing protein [Rhodocyclales bacterium]